MKKILFVVMIFITVLSAVACQRTHTHTVTGELIIEKEATCNEDGWGYTFCSKCGKMQEIVDIPKTNEHNIVTIPAIEPTCSNYGVTEGKKCCECGEVTVAQQISPKKAHTLTILPAVEATCTETGLSEGRQCTVCGEIIVAQQEIPKAAHREVYLMGTEATCSKPGLTEGKKCSVCSEILIAQQEIPVIAHTYTDKYDETCNKCGYVRPDAECAHEEKETIKGCDSTCTSTGLTDGEKCQKCGEILVSQTVISAKGHNEVTDEAVEATCTSTGLTEGKHCRVCNMVLIAQEVISIKPHTEVIDEAVEPTCTTIGLTEGKHCGICNTVLIAQTVINAKGHSFGDWVTIKESTLTEQGLQERYCECGQKEKQYLDFLEDPNASKGLVYHLNSDRQSYSVSQGTCTDANVVIPYYYKGLPVTIINATAFYKCESIISIVIPDSVTSIGYSAFCYCDSLTNVEIPNSVTSIDEGTFYCCESLVSVEIPDSVISIGNDAFYKCNSLTNIVIPDSVTSIGDWAFYGCSSLTNIEIPDSVVTIGKDAFYYCDSLTSVEFGDNSQLTNIGNSVFSDCYKLTNVSIGNSVITIGTGAFFKCYSLTSIVIPDSVTSIGNSAFADCTSLTSIEIPDSVTNIGRCAFSGCNSLTSIKFGDNSELLNIGYRAFFETNLRTVDIPNGVVSIGSQAFAHANDIYGNYNFKYIFIPDSVTSIGENILYNTTARIYCQSIQAHEDWDDNWHSGKSVRFNVINLGTTSEGLRWILNPDNTASISYFDDVNFEGEVLNIPSSIEGYPVTCIEYNSIQSSKIREVYIPETVLDINCFAFSSTKVDIHKIVIDENNPKYHSDGNCVIETATNTLIVGCNASVIPDYVTSIGMVAFQFCTGMKIVYIPESVENIGYAAFLSTIRIINCAAEEKPDGWHKDWINLHGGFPLNGITINWGVKKNDSNENFLLEGSQIIGYLGESSKILIPSEINGQKIDSIGAYVFSNHHEITEVIISNGIENIAENAFYDCASLTTIEIPNSVTSIGARAFAYSGSLTTIKIPDSVTSIGGGTFYCCTSLKDVELGHGIKNIVTEHDIFGSHGMFAGCKSLTSIVIPNSVTSIDGDAFLGCESLTSIVIPNSVKSIGKWAFRKCDSLTIYCEAESQPDGWDDEWNYFNCPVVWGYTSE